MNHMHKITLFLLIAAAVRRSDTEDTVPIDVRPVSMTVQPGSVFSLVCDFHMVSAPKVKVNWMFTNISDTSDPPRLTTSPNEDDHFQQSDFKNQSTLTVRNVTVNHSGWYFCKVIVEIPRLKVYVSNGSQVIIAHNDTALSTNITGASVWMWVGVGMGTAAIFALMLFWILWRRKRRLERENPVYVNTRPKVQSWTPKQPSPRPHAQTDLGKILTHSTDTTPTPARAHDKNRLYENTHPTPRSSAQAGVTSRTRLQAEARAATYENVTTEKTARKHQKKARPKV
ncbi:hypothetical protein ACEWY4_015045 [Coilia grayii]|uniref:Ig-like domain-containing protein n=1 Tax=Coilia grayii TaxID=363190 RepID=A0ABD1JU10_9TELE